MINENDYNDIKEKAQTLRYTSMTYVDYEDCSQANILLHEPDAILLLDENSSPSQVHFAANKMEKLFPFLARLNHGTQINFVPHDYQARLESIGFLPWAEFIDYFNFLLAETSIGDTSYNDIDFLSKEECRTVSDLSISCANQSRGFSGESAQWFANWLEQDDVIIARQGDKIAGFCCVSIYGEGTTLWIREIAVSPSFQRQGFGKKLMEQAISYGVHKGAIKGFLSADVLNHHAIALYKKYGFSAKEEKGELQMRMATPKP